MNSKQQAQASKSQSHLSGVRASLHSLKLHVMTVAMLFMLAPVVSSAMEIGNLFHGETSSESTMPCHNDEPSSTQCCCHEQPDGHACQCSSGQCVGSTMTLIISGLDHSYDQSGGIHPVFILVSRESPPPPINLRPPITHL